MIWIVEYAINGKRRTKRFDKESEADKFCWELDKLIVQDKCGGYLVTQKEKE